MPTEPPQLEPLNVLNLRNHIEHRLRRAIVSGTFKPGARLVETDIADQLGVSRAPVREALAALEREGIISHVPRQGYFVLDFSDKDIEEIYSLRMVLEIEALRRAIARCAEEDLQRLQSIVDELREAARRGSEPEQIVTLDLSFHEGLCHLADHGRLFSAWQSMRTLTQTLIGITSQTTYDHPEQPAQWHQDILDAIRHRDSRRAEEVLIDHIMDAQRRAGAALRGLRSSQKQEEQAP